MNRENPVVDASALRALAHPLRVRIYDILSRHGAQTASSLAQQLGESSGSTSYHLRILARSDLIREVDGRGTGRERWWERPPGGFSFAGSEAMDTPAGRATMQIVMSEFLRDRQAELVEFIERRFDAESEDWQDATLVSTTTARLTPAQTSALTRGIRALIDQTVDAHRTQTGEAVRTVTIRADVFPLRSAGGR